MKELQKINNDDHIKKTLHDLFCKELDLQSNLQAWIKSVLEYYKEYYPEYFDPYFHPIELDYSQVWQLPKDEFKLLKKHE